MCEVDAERTDEALAEWEQGDIAEPPSGTTVSVPGSEAIERLAVLTQTCDIRRSVAERSFLSLAPIVRLEGTNAALAARGRSPQFAPLLLDGETVFADLDRIVTVQKPDLVDWHRTPGVVNAEDGRRFANCCGRKFARAAFPNDLASALDKFRKRVIKKHGKCSREGAALDLLEDIRVTGTPSWDAPEIDVFVLFCPASEEELVAFGARELEQLAQSWLDLCVPHGAIRSIDGSVIPLDQLSARDYVDSDPLDLGHLSVEGHPDTNQS